MSIKSTGRSRERVVAFGMEGTGKSELAKDIAAHLAPGQTLYVIDNDNAWDRMLEGLTIEGEEVAVREEYRWVTSGKTGSWASDDEWCSEGGNIVIYHADGWESNIAAIDEVKRVAQRDDWCCIDSGSALWDDVQAWFTESVFTSSMSDYFMQVRLKKADAEKEAKALGAFDGWVDWPVINAVYKDNVMKFLVTPPCHLIVCCEQADVTREETDKETRALYGSAGASNVKPRGQKRIGHNVQTVLRLGREQNGMHKVWTVKDRGGREKLVGENVTDVGFSTWYLENVAGWVDEEEVQVPVAKVAAKAVVAKG